MVVVVLIGVVLKVGEILLVEVLLVAVERLLELWRVERSEPH